MSTLGYCEACRHYRDLFCRNPESPYGGRVRLPVHKCHAHKPAALTTAQAEIEALRGALHDAICMIGHAMPMDTTVLAGRRLVALEVWQAGYDLLNPKHNKDAI